MSREHTLAREPGSVHLLQVLSADMCSFPDRGVVFDHASHGLELVRASRRANNASTQPFSE